MSTSRSCTFFSLIVRSTRLAAIFCLLLSISPQAKPRFCALCYQTREKASLIMPFSSPQTLPSGLCTCAKSNNAPLRSCRRQGNAPPAVKKSPLKKAISKFGVRAQHTVLMRITHASPSSQKSFLQKYFCEVLLFFHFIISGEAFAFCYYYAKKGFTALCLFSPNLPTLWLMGKE